jgi:hypothetical protein
MYRKARFTSALLAAGLIATTLAIGPAQALAGPLNVIVATGTVTDTTGAAVPGAIVKLYAWPSDAVLDGLATGQQVPTTLLTTTTADSNGVYSLSMLLADLQSAATVGTIANLEVDSGDSQYFFDFDTATGTSLAASAATTGTANASTAVPAGVNLPNTTLGTVPDVCTPYTYQRQMARDWASVGSTYIWNDSQGVTGSFTYSHGQNSSLGIAVKATASGTNPDLTGGFSAAGTRTDSANTTVGYPNRGTGFDIEYQTQWRTALYKSECTHVVPKPYHWHVRENSWIGGQKLISETSPPSTQNGICSRFVAGAGSQFQTSNAHAVTWTGSLGLGMADIGFDATAQTGYDTSAQITYGFANATHVNFVCGTDTVPANAKRVVVQSHLNP